MSAIWRSFPWPGVSRRRNLLKDFMDGSLAERYLEVPAREAGIEHSRERGVWDVRVSGGGLPVSDSDSN